MAGTKRIRIDHDSSITNEGENNRIAPKDYSFNFIPTLKPSQKIFDLDLAATIDESRPRPIEFSANTLTHRFNIRSQNFRVEESKTSKSNLIVLNSIRHQHTKTSYEPMYLRHQDISYTIITYLQMSFNIIITATVLYIFTKMTMVVKQDFKLKAQEHSDLLHKEKLACIRNYEVNHCGQEDRVPAIENMCIEWLSCMQKEVVVAQAKVSAEAIAEIINSFVEPISYKTLLFFTLLIVGSLLFSNLAFGIFRRKYTRAQRAPLPATIGNR